MRILSLRNLADRRAPINRKSLVNFILSRAIPAGMRRRSSPTIGNGIVCFFLSLSFGLLLGSIFRMNSVVF